MRDETRQWLAKADKDFGTAIFAMQSIDGPLPVTIGLHCQQSTEKYLKAYLQENGIRFLDQQTLIALFDNCVGIDKSFEALRTEISQLEGYSIAVRYPKMEDVSEFNQAAIETVKRIKEFVMSKFN